MTLETQLKHTIKYYLKIKNIFYWYNIQGLGAYPGIPDIMALKDNKLYCIEVKAPKGKLSPYQISFKDVSELNGAIWITAKCLEDVQKYL